MTKLLSAALNYASRGWRVHPLTGKKAVLQGWPSLGTTDTATITGWWAQYPAANVGIITGRQSNLFVLDVDPGKGGDNSLRELEAQYGPLPNTVEVLTGKDGRHFYFQYPGGVVGNSNSKLDPGLDIKTDGGYVVAPSSIHPETGRTYEWEAAHHPDDVTLAQVPRWMLDKLTARPEPTRSTHAHATIPEGQRNDALTREAGRLRHIGLNGPELEAALLTMNRERCAPPLPDDEVRSIAASIARYPTEDATATVSRALFRRVADVQARPIHWLWPGRIARGKVSIIAGNPGLGKSQVTVGMAATVSTGGLWPVDGKCCEVGNVIILSAEDDPSDTIRPRLEAAGADLSRVYILDAVLDGPLVGSSETPRAFNLKTDMDQLESMLKEIRGAALVIIDPITAYLGTTDSHKNAEIRALLSPLAELAGRYGAAVVAVSHFNKNANTEALMRVTGSLAFVAAARAAYVVAKDPEHEARRLFLPLKNNLGNDQTGLAFTVESAQVESTIGRIETSRVVWEPSAVTVTAEQAMKPQVHNEERSDLDDAKDFLRGLLAEGPVPSKQIRGDAEGAGHAWRTIQRAQKALGIVPFKKGMKEGWFWQLATPSCPEECHEPPKNAVPGGWQPSYSSGGVGGLQGDDTLPVEVEI
jgi:KaiC/GvpD/RAD55 family RecA-like ATPase